MMFNGFLMCGDSDASDVTKDSIASGGSAASDAARARSLENKLMATMEVLKNKEETCRLQAESLSLAEARIAALSARSQPLQTPFSTTRRTTELNHVEMKDVSAEAELQDSKLVKTLRDNLSVIEELYRECFYETAKQEELITMLRRAYLDMRLVERQKTEQIDYLQNTLKTQKNSFDRCEDIAMEVENLKTEISNFLNNSTNNDSGVWEREESAGEVCAELRAVAAQLRRLRDLLHIDCVCGLEEENMKLKQKNDAMEIQIGELRQRLSDLEDALQDKENIDHQYQHQIQEKEKEIQRMRQQLKSLENGTRDQGSACETLTMQLKQLEVIISDKTRELLSIQERCDEQEATIRVLREELHKADIVVNENKQVRAEVWQLSAGVARWREQLADARRRLRALDAELRRARSHCAHLAEHYREKSETARELQAQLEEAQARGAALCAEAQRAVRGVRRWLAAQRERLREQDDKIKEQELLIKTLQQSPARSNTSSSENEPCCSKYLTQLEVRRSESNHMGPSETTGCSKCAYSRENNFHGSETASSPLPPTPPRRLLRKKPFSTNKRCQCPLTRSAGVQLDGRVSCERALSSYRDTPSREMSPPEELLERVERASEALSAAQRRWARARGGSGGA